MRSPATLMPDIVRFRISIVYFFLWIPLRAQSNAGGPPWLMDMTDEQHLLHKLRHNYDPSVRPVFDAKTAVLINLGITLTQIIDVDEKNQVLTTNVWLDQNWTDEKLKWNETDYHNISILRIPCDFIWLPDIVLYNSVENHNKGYMKALAMVEYNGNVFWPPIVRMRSSCKMDITYFPFDDQICKLKLGSWAYDGNQVDVTNRTLNVDLSNYVDNGEWELMDTKVIRNVKYYPCCPQPFPDVVFLLHIRRRVLYYLLNVIIPCMLLSSLSLTGFLLPPDSGEKVTLGLTVLLAFSVFMLLVAENMPPTSEYIPLIGIYLTVIMAMSALSVALSVFVLNCHHRGAMLHRPPRLVRTLAHGVAKMLCMNLRYLRSWGSSSCRGPSLSATCGAHNNAGSPCGGAADYGLHNTGHTSSECSGVGSDLHYHRCHLLQQQLMQQQPPQQNNVIDSGLNGLISGNGGGGGGGGGSGDAPAAIWARQNQHHHADNDTNSSHAPVHINNSNNIHNTNCSPNANHNSSQNNAVSTTLLHNSNNLNFYTEGVRSRGGGEAGGGGNGRGGGGESTAATAKIEQEILQYLRTVLEAHERSKLERVAVNEWQEVARVLDKLFFWLFVIITTTSTLVLLVFSPMTKDVNFEQST